VRASNKTYTQILNPIKKRLKFVSLPQHQKDSNQKKPFPISLANLQPHRPLYNDEAEREILNIAYFEMISEFTHSHEW